MQPMGIRLEQPQQTDATHGQHRLGISLKLAAGAIIVGLLAAETALPPLAVAAGLVVVLTAFVYVERRLIGQAEPTTL